MKEEKGVKYNQGKTRHDLKPAFAEEQYARVLTFGANKYTKKWETEIQKLFTVSNAISLKIGIAKKCVAVVTKNNLGKIILPMQKGNVKIEGIGKDEIPIELENWQKLENWILKKELEIKEQNGKLISETLDLQSKNIKNSVKKVVRYVGLKDTCILTMTIPQENLEESYVASATTVLECLAIMKKVLKEHLNISWENYDLINSGDRNWEKGLPWSAIIGALERHLLAIKRGEDYDPETGILHSAHVMTNAAFLTEYYRIYPEGDDRPLPPRKRIGLDVDGVLANFGEHVKEKKNIQGYPNHWYYSYDFNSQFWNKMRDDDEFWGNLPPYLDGKRLPFEPVVYITHRPVKSEVTKGWLEKHNFPCMPVETVGGTHEKLEVAKEYKLDIFVEDNYETFRMMNEGGVFTYLLDRPWNSKYKVGHRRIKSLEEINI